MLPTALGLLVYLPMVAVAGQLAFHETVLGSGPAFPQDQAHQQRTYYEPTLSCCDSESGESAFLRDCSTEDGKTLSVRLITTRKKGKVQQSTYEVTVNDRSMVRFKVIPRSTEPPIERLCWLGDDWLVAYPGHVIVSGEDLAKKYHYQSVFYYRRVSGQALFFFRKGDRIGLSYGAKEQARHYSKVVYHPPQDLALYDIRSNDERVWFFGYRRGHWYFVDATVTKN